MLRHIIDGLACVRVRSVGWIGASMSFIRVGRIAQQPINNAGLRRAERDPVLGCVLQGEEERFCFPNRPLAKVLSAIELELKGKSADERPMIAPGTPESD